MNKWIKYGAGAIIGLYVLGRIAGGGDDAPTTNSPAAPANAPAEAPAEKPAEVAELGSEGNPVPLGQTHTGKVWAWTVNAVTDLGQTVESGNQFIDNLTTTGRFVRVDYTVKNVGTDASFVDAPALVDSTGREFSSKSEGGMLLEEAQRCVLEQVNPGLDRPCSWIYELPADAAGLRIAVKDGAFSKPALLATE